MLCGRPVGLAWEKEGISWGQILVEYTEVWPEKAPGPSAWETIINPGEGRDVRLSHHGNVLASVFLRLLVLESMWQIAVLAPYSGSKQGA